MNINRGMSLALKNSENCIYSYLVKKYSDLSYFILDKQLRRKLTKDFAIFLNPAR